MERNYFAHSSNSLTHEEYEQLKSDERAYKDYLIERPGTRLGSLLLDSSLISTSKWGFYSIKVIECGNYLQVYQFDRKHSKKPKNDDKLIDVKEWVLLDSLDLYTKVSSERECYEDNKKIEFRNILRSKQQMERLVKANEHDFKTFITLTFEENITDIAYANKKFNQYISNLRRRLKSDFKYVCVPEFQKRGAIHYHMLTNIDYDNLDLLSKYEKKIYKKNKGWQTFKILKSWHYGFSNVQKLDNVEIVSYLNKYMTKDIDNRLWGKRRYLYSMNLRQPKTFFLDLDQIDDFIRYLSIHDNFKENYSNNYYDKFDNLISFKELKRVV